MPKLNTVYDIGAAFEAIENELISSMIRNMRRRVFFGARSTHPR